MIIKDCGHDIPIGFYYLKLSYDYAYDDDIIFKVCGREITLKDLLEYFDDKVFRESLGRSF